MTDPVKSTIATRAETKFFAWAMMDRKTGEITGSANSRRHEHHRVHGQGVARVSDFLRLKAAAEQDADGGRAEVTSTAIRDSNDKSARVRST